MDLGLIPCHSQATWVWCSFPASTWSIRLNPFLKYFGSDNTIDTFCKYFRPDLAVRPNNFWGRKQRPQMQFLTKNTTEERFSRYYSAVHSENSLYLQCRPQYNVFMSTPTHFERAQHRINSKSAIHNKITYNPQ
jgi:hypothetical protein